MNSDKNSFLKNERGGFAKSVIIPFASGILGALLVIGICFSIPNIKSKIIGEVDSGNETTTVSSEPSSSNLVSLSNYSDTSVSVAEKVLPSIVGINVEYTVNSMFNRQSSASAEGSGIIISNDGYILTNNHIVNSSSTSSYYQVSEASKISVYIYGDDTPYEATIVGTDELTDLAVIKIEKDGLTAAELGNSDNVKIGEFVMAVGNPLGMQNSVSTGVVSAINRKVTDSDGKEYTLIQTDSAINSGNSGGALVNGDGEVIGINTLKFSGTGVEGMGFAIPINSTKDIYEQLIQYNKVKRPYIGISGTTVDESNAQKYNLVVGVYVSEVANFSPAQVSGIKAGDVITKLNSTTIKTMNELNTEKNKHEIGTEVTVTVYRDGKETDIKITLSETP